MAWSHIHCLGRRNNASGVYVHHLCVLWNLFLECCYAIFLWLKEGTKKTWQKSALLLETHCSMADQCVVCVYIYQHYAMSYESHFGVKCAYAGHLATLISFYKRVIYNCHDLWRNEIASHKLCLYRVDWQQKHCIYCNLLV